MANKPSIFSRGRTYLTSTPAERAQQKAAREQQLADDEAIRSQQTAATPVAPATPQHVDTSSRRVVDTQPAPKRNWPIAIVGFLLILVMFISFGGPALISSLVDDRVRGSISALEAERDKLKTDLDASNAAKDAAENARKAAEDAKAEAEKKLNERPAAPAPDNTQTVGNADGEHTPDQATAQQLINQDIYRKLTQQQNQIENADWRFWIDRGWAETVNPGYGVMGLPVYNEQELVSALANGSAGSETVITGVQQKHQTGNNLTIARQNVLVATNWQCVQHLKESKSKDMASISNGQVVWNDDLVDPAGTVSCTYVGPEVRDAVKAGKNVIAYGIRGPCQNVQETPVTVQEIPSLPRITPPTGTTVVYNPPKETPPTPTCNHNCKPPVDVCVQPSSPGEGWTWDQENCKWCPPIDVCIQPTSPGEGYTWNEEGCVYTPPTVDECIQPTSPGEGWTWDQENCKWCPPVDECVKGDSPGEGYTWNEEACEWCPPVVEECPDGYVPNPDTNHPVKCLLKNPALDPSETGNAPDNGTPMSNPGPATPPAVPEEEAPVVYEPPAIPEPVVETPRPTEEIPPGEGAAPTAPVVGTVDETVCEMCGGGMSDTAQVASVTVAAAPAPAVVQPAAVAVQPVAAPVAASAVVTEPASAPVIQTAAPAAPIATQVASAPAMTDAPVQTAIVAVVSSTTAAG